MNSFLTVVIGLFVAAFGSASRSGQWNKLFYNCINLIASFTNYQSQVTIYAPGRYGPSYIGKQSIDVRGGSIYKNTVNFTLTVDDEPIEPRTVKSYDIVTPFNVSTVDILNYIWMPKNGSPWDFHNIAQIDLLDKESNYTKKFDGPWTLRPFQVGAYCPENKLPNDENCG